MTADLNARIEALIATVSNVLGDAPPKPMSPALAEVIEQFKRMTPAGRLRVMAMYQLERTVEAFKAEEVRRFPFDQEIAIAQRWARDMGRVARRLPGDIRRAP